MEGRVQPLLLLLLYWSAVAGGEPTNRAEHPSDTGRQEGDVCYCWSPNQVSLTRQNSTAVVQWEPFYFSEHLIVSIIDSKHQTPIIKETISKNNLSKSRTTEFHVQWKYPNTYIQAVVGARCRECRRRFRTSPPLLWLADAPDKTDTASSDSRIDEAFTTAIPPPDDGSYPRRSIPAPPSQPMSVVLLLVCVLAVVAAVKAAVPHSCNSRDKPEEEETIASMEDLTSDSSDDIEDDFRNDCVSFSPPDSSSDTDSAHINEQFLDIVRRYELGEAV